MREALAGTNHDFLLRDDKPSDSRRRGGRGKANKSAWARLFGGRRRGVAFVSLIALAAIGIPLNALYLQEGRHPAPLFRINPPEASVEPKAHVAAPAPLPPARPAIAAPTQAAPVVKPAAARSEPTHTQEKRDQIGALLDGGAPKSEEADKNVLAAQRALVKLGYVLRPDGVFGSATRQALEKFERDSGLPVKGELTPKIMRQLHARSGVPTE